MKPPVVKFTSPWAFSSLHRGLITLLLGIVAPFAMPRDASAQIYVSTDAYGTIGEYAADGTVINGSLVTGLNPGQIVLSGSILFVANGTPGTVGKYNAITGAAINANFITGLNIPNGLAVSGNKLYVANIGSNTVGVYDATTGAVIKADLIPGLGAPCCLTLSGNDLFVTSHSSGTVGIYDATTGVAINSSLVTGLNAPGGTALSGSNLFVVNQGNDEVGEYNAVTGAVINAGFITQLDNPANVAVSGGELFVTDQWASTVGEYDASTGAVINASLITGVGLCNGIIIVSTGTTACTVTTRSSPAAGGSTTGAGVYSTGGNVVVTASANSGYSFSNWTENGSVVSTSTSYTFSISGSTSLVANFTSQAASAQIYVSQDVSSAAVVEYGSDGTAINTDFISGPNPGQIALSGTVLFVTDGANGVVGEYNAITGAAINANFIAGLNGPNGIAVSGNRLYVANMGSNTVGVYDATTGAVINANLIPGLSAPGCLTIAGNELIVTNSEPNSTIGVYDATTGAAINANFITGLNYPGGTAVFGNNLFVTQAGGDEISEYNATTGALINASFITGLDWPPNVAVSGGDLFVTNQWSGTVGEYDATTGAPINLTFITGLGLCNGIAIASTGTTTCAVTANSSPADGGSTTGTGDYWSGGSVTVTASANSGYIFKDWTEGGIVVSTSTSYTFSFNGATSLVANFTSYAGQPEEWVVTNKGDHGPGTLRDAITGANAGDTITFAPNLKGTITLTSGELPIPSDLAIIGPGADRLAVSGNHASRVFNIGDGVDHAGNVSISGLTLLGGNDASGNGGGSIYTALNLTLTECVLSGNASNGDGGGICNDGGVLSMISCDIWANKAGSVGGGIENRNGGTATLDYCAVSGNLATTGTIGHGGGIHNSDATLTLTQCTISNNKVSRNGGGILNYSGDLTMDDCTVSGNLATTGTIGNGGGIDSNGEDGSATLALTQCTISGNKASHTGGGIYNDQGNLILNTCTVSRNSSGVFGAGIGQFEASGTLTDCTISGNVTSGSSGGGIHLDGENTGSFTMTGCTVSGNDAKASGGGIDNYENNLSLTLCTISGNSAGKGGGGIASFSSPLTIIACTVDNNKAGTSGGGILDSPASDPASTIQGSIIAGNNAAHHGPDFSGSAESMGYNLIGNPEGSSGFGATGDLLGTSSNPLNAMLGKLADNGGPTLTQALLFGSPAIDSVFGSVLNLTADQRGVAFPFGLCDIGAFDLCGPAGVAVNAASSVTETSATLNATVETNGLATSVQFYLNGTRVLSPLEIQGGTLTQTTVSLPVRGLKSGTDYSCFITATNSGGTATSLPVTLTTSP